MSVCTDPNYHTDCAWNECCGYLEACCTRAANANECDYTGLTAQSTPEEYANKYPECRDPYDLDANVPGKTGKFYLKDVKPNDIPGVTQPYTDAAAWGPREFGEKFDGTYSAIVGPIAGGAYPKYYCLDANLNKVRDNTVTT